MRPAREDFTETKTKKLNTVDFTEGGIIRKLIKFAIPMALATAVQVLFNAADIAVVGQMSGENGSLYQGAIGATTSIIHLIVYFFIGIGVGVNVVMSNAFGAKDADKQHRVVHTSITLSLIFGLIVLVLGTTLARPVLALMGTTSAQIEYSTTYMRIYMFGAPGLIVYNFAAALLRSVGETRKPLLYLFISGLINIVINIITVAVFKMHVVGVALGTVISQYVACVWILIDLMRFDGPARLKLGKLRLYGKELRSILVIGITNGINQCMFSIANVIIQSHFNAYGPMAVSGEAVARNLESFNDAFAGAVNASVITIVGQNCGARKPERIPMAIRAGFICAITLEFVYSLTMVTLGQYILMIFTTDPVVIRWAMIKVYIVSGTEMLVSMMYSYGSALRGMGYSVSIMIINLFCTCVVRIVFLFAIYPFLPTLTMYDMPTALPHIGWIYGLFPLTWALSGITQIIMYYCVKRKAFAVIGENASDETTATVSAETENAADETEVSDETGNIPDEAAHTA